MTIDSRGVQKILKNKIHESLVHETKDGGRP